MPDDIIHFEGEPARALTAALPALPELLQTLEGFKNMSETAAQLMQAVTSNAEATASLRQAFDTFRTEQQTRLQEALARVETEVAAMTLLRHGCHRAQGFLLSRPIDGAAMKALLAKGRVPVSFAKS